MFNWDSKHNTSCTTWGSTAGETVLNTVAGQEVCETRFRMVYGLRYNRFNSVKASFASGVVIAKHGRLGKSRIGEASIQVTCWLRTFVQKVGDQVPTCSFAAMPHQGRCLGSCYWWSLAGWTNLLQTIHILQDMEIRVSSCEDPHGIHCPTIT